MNWLKKFFTTKVNLIQGDTVIAAIEFDRDKNYVLVVKMGSLSQREWNHLLKAVPHNVHVTWANF